MLTPTTVGGLKQSLKCVMRWGLHHQCPGYVVVSVTEQAYQHLILLNTLEELSHFHLDHLLSELDKQFSSHKKSPAFQGQYLGPSVLVTEDLATVSSVVMKVGQLYAIDLPNVPSLCGEIHNWYTN